MDDNDADQNKIAVEVCEKGVELYITDVDQRKDAKDNKGKRKFIILVYKLKVMVIEKQMYV